MEAGGTDSKKILAILKLLVLLFILAGIPAFLYFRYGSEIFSADAAERIIAYLKANESTAALIIILLQTVQVVICFLPGQPVQFAASYMFGVIGGLALSLAGAVIGVMISFYIAKLLGRDAVHMIFGEERVSDYRRKLNSGKGLSLAFLIYLIPGIPKDLVSYVAGISEMRFLPFMIVSTVGRIPGMAGSLLFGYFFKEKNYAGIAAVCVLMGLILLVFFIRRKDIYRMLDDIERMSSETEGRTEDNING